MGQRAKRRYCTAAESAEIWDRWQRGEGLISIGRVFGKSSGSIFSHLMPFGGICPRPRRRSRLALTLVEREQISRGLVNGDSLRLIATSLGRAASTVSREVARNGGLSQYRAAASEKHAWVRALRPKLCKLATHPPLRKVVARLLRRNWSPQQIAGWLKRKHPDEEAFRVSHETIYRSLFVQTRGVLTDTAGFNTAIGYEALKANTSGKHNIALGWEAGLNVETGSNNIDIGNPDEATDGEKADNAVIRIGTQSPTALQSQTFIAGIYDNIAVTGIAVVIDSNGQLGTVPSSERFKTAIEPMGANTAKLRQLRPVTFRYKADSQGTQRYGLIAE
jgi:Helix-turn-helix domain/Chaperone of endosialidase